ncbi:MAG: chloride channel protein [Promethearchaeota archaeon]
MKPAPLFQRWMTLYFLTIIMGIIGGLSAVGLRASIEFITKIFQEWILPYVSIPIGQFNIAFLIFPLVGALLSGLIFNKISNDTKGSGIPVLLETMILKEGKIPIKTGILKIIHTSFTLGSGGNGGREGPIALIGGSFGSALGRYFKLKPKDIRLLITCGVGAGIAGTFKAPIGGALFGMEIIFQGIPLIQAVPVFLASAIGAMIGMGFYGIKPIFTWNTTLESIHPVEYGFVIIQGLIFAIIAVGWVKFFYFTQEGYEKFKIPEWLKPLSGNLITGILLMFFVAYNGDLTGIYGTGFLGIQNAINGAFLPWLLLLFGVLKMIGTVTTVGSGSSGGITGPSIYIGGMLGGAWGFLMELIYPQAVSSPYLYCFIGMATFYAAAAQAPLNISLIVAELTRQYELLPALMISAVTAYLLSRILLHGKSVYTMRLYHLGEGLKSDSIMHLEKVRVSDVMEPNVITISPSLPLTELAKLSADHQNIRQFPVLNFGTLVGIVELDTIFNIPYDQWERINVYDIMDKKFVRIGPEDPLQDAIDKMHKYNLRCLLVTKRIINDHNEREEILQGLLTLKDIVRVWNKSQE